MGAGFFIVLISASVMALLIQIQPEGDLSQVYYGTDTRIFALLMGGLLGVYEKQLRKKRIKNRFLEAVAFLLLMVAFLWLYFVVDGQSTLTYWLILVPSAFIAASLINLCADIKRPFGRCLDCPPLRWFGKHSYELYLVQYPIIFFVSRKPPTDSDVWNTLIAFVLILLAAQWIYQVITLLQTGIRSKFHGKKTL